MLLQVKISDPGMLLKLFVAIDDGLKGLQPRLAAKQLPRDRRGGTPQLRASEIITMMVWGAWRGLTDKAKG